MMENEVVQQKSRKGLMIALITAAVLVAGGLALWFFVFKGENTPEKLAQEIIDASTKKDWKAMVDMTPDEVLEILLKTDAEEMQKRNISTVKELRSWALEHVSSIPDPMNGKPIQNAELGEVVKMTPEEYIDLFLAGEGENAYYTFLKSRDEIAVVKINYEMVDGDSKLERKDTVLTYRQGRKWYPLTGLQVVYNELATVN